MFNRTIYKALAICLFKFSLLKGTWLIIIKSIAHLHMSSHLILLEGQDHWPHLINEKIQICPFGNSFTHVVLKSGLKSRTFSYTYLFSTYSLLVAVIKSQRVLAFYGTCPGRAETEFGIISACVDNFIRCWALTQLAGRGGDIRSNDSLNQWSPIPMDQYGSLAF